jgi:hypothetical protein
MIEEQKLWFLEGDFFAPSPKLNNKLLLLLVGLVGDSVVGRTADSDDSVFCIGIEPISILISFVGALSEFDLV